ncbi:MAG: hypothetical protein IKW04_02795 [Clostridia bacterium]|nr:hypothetical protein [Clostridia bacterium]
MFMIGLSLLSSGIAFAAVMSIYLSDLKSKTYFRYIRPSEVQSMETMITVGWVLVVVGVIVMLCAWAKRKQDCAALALYNAQTQNHCPVCNIDVVSYAQHCPICGRTFRQ